jgi:hypothetical protein
VAGLPRAVAGHARALSAPLRSRLLVPGGAGLADPCHQRLLAGQQSCRRARADLRRTRGRRGSPRRAGSHCLRTGRCFMCPRAMRRSVGASSTHGREPSCWRPWASSHRR